MARRRGRNQSQGPPRAGAVAPCGRGRGHPAGLRRGQRAPAAGSGSRGAKSRRSAPSLPLPLPLPPPRALSGYLRGSTEQSLPHRDGRDHSQERERANKQTKKKREKKFVPFSTRGDLRLPRAPPPAAPAERRPTGGPGAGRRGQRWPPAPQARRRRRRPVPSPAPATHFVRALRQLVHLLGVPRHGAGGEAAGGESFVLRKAPRPQPSAASADSASPSAANKLSKTCGTSRAAQPGWGLRGRGCLTRQDWLGGRGWDRLTSPRLTSAGRAAGPASTWVAAACCVRGAVSSSISSSSSSSFPCPAAPPAPPLRGPGAPGAVTPAERPEPERSPVGVRASPGGSPAAGTRRVGGELFLPAVKCGFCENS